jgi:hypothetical protein
MKTTETLFGAHELALFMACFHLSEADFGGFLGQDDEILS